MLSTGSLQKNIASLGALQAFNFLLTMATLPYLARILGADRWGHIVFVLLIINYLTWVANWGFYLGATKRISAKRADRDKRTRIFIATWMAQWVLTVALLLILPVAVFMLPILRDDWYLYLAAAGLLIGNALMPLWLLNGLEMIRQSALIQIGVKLVALPNIFIFVKHGCDMPTYLWINSASSILVGIATIFWIYRIRLVDFSFPRFNEVCAAVIDDFHLFVSAMWANLNTAVIPTALGIWGGATELGYYNLADRARNAAITILNPITHALFPRMCYLFENEWDRAMGLLKRSGMTLFLLTLLMSSCLLLFSNPIISVLGGQGFREASSVLKLLAFAPLFTTLSAFMIHQILIPRGAFKGYSMAVFLTLLANASFIIPAILLFGIQGAAAICLGTEMLTVMILMLYIRYKRILSANTDFSTTESAQKELKL